MPLYKTIPLDDNTTIYVWKVTESEADLLADVTLSNNSIQRLQHMKSELHRRGYLSIRHLLRTAGVSDLQLYYDEYGKPHLDTGDYISITHSFHFTGIIVSKTTPVGIDIEMQREKIERIAHRFVPIEYLSTIKLSPNFTRLLTVNWGAKEALYKIYAQPGLSFLEHIFIAPVHLGRKKVKGAVYYDNDKVNYNIQFFEMENFTCVFALQESLNPE